MNRKKKEKELWAAVQKMDILSLEKIYLEVDIEYFNKLRRIDQDGYEPKGFRAFEEFHGLVCAAVMDLRSKKLQLT